MKYIAVQRGLHKKGVPVAGTPYPILNRWQMADGSYLKTLIGILARKMDAFGEACDA